MKVRRFIVDCNSLTSGTKAEANMYEAVRSQATSSALAVRNISESRDSIKQLSSKIKEIKGKAAQSEIMVQEICRDIKRLDYAKKNLTLTITSLKRFHMLIKGVDKLEFMVSLDGDESCSIICILLEGAQETVSRGRQLTSSSRRTC